MDIRTRSRSRCGHGVFGKSFDRTIAHHAAVRMCNDDHVSSLARLVEDSGSSSVDIIFECGLWVVLCRREGYGDAFEVVCVAEWCDDLGVAGW